MTTCRWLLICLLITVLALGPTIMAQDSKMEIKLAHVHAGNFESEIHTAAVAFADYVNRFGKNIEVKVYPSSQLGNERDVIEAIRLGGGADAMISGTAIYNNFCRKIGVLDLPFIWKSYDHVHKVLDGKVGDELAKELDKIGIKVLAWMDSWGYRNVVTTKVRVTKPEDLEGLKLRTIETPIYVGAVNLMGANATPMAFGEIYTALQTGVLDGFEHGASVILSNKFYEVTKYIALTRHLFGPLVFSFSKQTWNELSDYNKKIVQNAAIIARDWQRGLAPIMEEKAFEQLRAEGMEINEIDMSEIKKKAETFQRDYAKKLGALDLLEIILNTQ